MSEEGFFHCYPLSNDVNDFTLWLNWVRVCAELDVHSICISFTDPQHKLHGMARRSEEQEIVSISHHTHEYTTKVATNTKLEKIRKERDQIN